MDPQTDPTQTAADKLTASLSVPPQPAPEPLPSSQPSARDVTLETLQAQSLRIDQMSKAMTEQAQRVEAAMGTVEATMQLAHLVIAQQDEQLTALAGLLERLETTAEALVRVQANLSEIVAALLGPPNQKG